MSIDLNWETLTTGPDGEALALRIRDFIHTKFQSVPLPRFIKSVTVHSFSFGAITPELELRDITDPLPDFYEENPDADDADSNEEVEDVPEALKAAGRRRRESRREGNVPPRMNTLDLTSPLLGVSTPGLLGSSNLHYLQSHLGQGWSGTQTPLRAVAAPFGGGWMDPPAVASSPGGEGHTSSHSRNPSLSSSISMGDFSAPSPGPPPQQQQQPGPTLREKSSVSTLAPTSAGPSRPPTRDASHLAGSAIAEDDEEMPSLPEAEAEAERRRFREPRVEDMQAVFRIRYAGDVKLMLTAEILLDYPMPSFVGIPVRLSITGLTFDGVGVLASIRKRLHFCFLSPEDALAAVGSQDDTQDVTGEGTEQGDRGKRTRFGGLLQEIRVESEIGQREQGKQSLKNVGKVERFVLEQVRRIFEDEFVYPSFWTFLV